MRNLLRPGWVLMVGIVLISGFYTPLFSQTTDRIAALAAQLDSLSTDIPGLNAATDISLRNVSLAEYIRAIGTAHEVNVYIADTDLRITSDLSQEPVKSVFLFICKQFSYTLDITGNIIAFLPYTAPKPLPPDPREPNIRYENGLLSVDLVGDSLAPVLRKISTLTGKKLITRPNTTGVLFAYLPPTPVDTALEALFLANGFQIIPRRKGYFVIQSTLEPETTTKAKTRQGRTDFSIERYTDNAQDYVSISAEDADLEALITELFKTMEVDFLIYDQLSGLITLEAEIIGLDEVLKHILQGTDYTYKKDGGLYLLGAQSLLGLRSIEIVHLKYRPTFQAIDLIPGTDKQLSTQRTNQNNPRRQNTTNNNPRMRNNQFNDPNYIPQTYSGMYSSYGNTIQSDASIPPEIIKTKVGEVEIVEYPELNRIILKGPKHEVDELAWFLDQIDQPVPMVKVKMIVVEVNTERLVSTGVEVGRDPENNQPIIKDLIPNLDYILDGQELNPILAEIPYLSNLGALRSDFYLRLKAQEVNGNLSIKMEPVLSMLNGRSASLLIGQTQYFLLETQTAATGINNFTQSTQRFERIEANIMLTLKPYISEDSLVTLEILPDFTTPVGSFDSNTPPTIATRRFDSTIRVKNGETVILGGLTEEQENDDSSGLPLLSRVPVLRRLVGKVDTGKSKSSLIIYITPTIFYN